MQNNPVLKILNFIFRLVLLCAAAGLLLSWVYQKTEPKIREHKAAAISRARKEVLQDAVRFDDSGQSYLTGYNEQDRMVGRIVQGSQRGYGGPVKVMVGVDSKGSIIGVRVLENYETPGLGDVIATESFTGQFAGLTQDEVNLVKDKGSIEAVTGATISSKGCIGAVKDALGNLTDNE